MNDEQLEFSISQYLDGTLSNDERAVLEARLSSDPAARAMLEEYRWLDGLIKSSAEPMPQVRWEKLADHLSVAIDQAADAPALTYRIGWTSAVRWMAIAASFVIAVGIGWHTFNHGNQPSSVIVQKPATEPSSVQIAEVKVTGPQAEPAKGNASIDVSIVRPPANATPAYGYGDGVVVHPSHVNLAGTAPTPDDSGRIR